MLDDKSKWNKKQLIRMHKEMRSLYGKFAVTALLGNKKADLLFHKVTTTVNFPVFSVIKQRFFLIIDGKLIN